MNDSTEKLLRQMALVEPPESLDQAILTAPHEARKGATTKSGLAAVHDGPSWWFAGVSAVACSLFGIAIGLLLANWPISTPAVSDLVGPQQRTFERQQGNAVSYQSSAGAPLDNSVAVDKAVTGPTKSTHNAIQLSDQGLFFLNGAQPVRKYRARTWRQVRAWDAQSGTEHSYQIPVWQIVLTPAPGV